MRTYPLFGGLINPALVPGKWIPCVSLQTWRGERYHASSAVRVHLDLGAYDVIEHPITALTFREAEIRAQHLAATL